MQGASEIKPLGFVRQVAAGLKVPLVGLKLLFFDSRLLFRAAMIGIVASFLLIALVYAAIFFTPTLTQMILEPGTWTYVLAEIGVFLALLPVVFVSHRVLTGVFSGRMQADLSRRTEVAVNSEAHLGPDNTSMLGDLGGQLVDLVKVLPIALFIFLVNFIPVAGQVIALGLSLVLTARATAQELVAIPMRHRQLDGAAIDGELKRHRVVWLVSSGIIAGLSLIPVVNILAIPAGVIGVTATYVTLEKEGVTPAAPSALRTG